MTAAPGKGACTCLCKRVSGFVADWGPPCAAALTWRGLRVTACLHGQDPPRWNPGCQTCGTASEGADPHPAAGREAEPYRLGCLSLAGQGGPGSSGFRLRAGSVAAGLLQGDRKEIQFLLWIFPPHTLLNERLHSGAVRKRPPRRSGTEARGAHAKEGVPWCITPLHSHTRLGFCPQARRRLHVSDHCSCWRNMAVGCHPGGPGTPPQPSAPRCAPETSPVGRASLWGRFSMAVAERQVSAAFLSGTAEPGRLARRSEEQGEGRGRGDGAGSC